MLEARTKTQQAELIDLRSKNKNGDKRALQMTREMNELLERVKTSSIQKNEALRDMEQIKRENEESLKAIAELNK